MDCVGGATLTSVLRTLRYGAAVAASGLTGGSTFESSVYPFIVRGASLIGIDTVQCPDGGAASGVERDGHRVPAATCWRTWSMPSWVSTSLGPVLELILAGGVRGRVLVAPAV